MDKIHISNYRGLTAKDSRFYRLSPFWTQNDTQKVSAITRVDCVLPKNTMKYPTQGLIPDLLILSPVAKHLGHHAFRLPYTPS